jgi:hypothetical protein
MPRTKPKTKRARKPKIKAVKGEVVVHSHAGQPTLYRAEYARLLFQHLSNGNSFETFITKVDPNPSSGKYLHVDTLYEWANKHPEFSEARERGNQARLELFETAARNIAMGLVPPPPQDADGKPVGMMTRGNAAMTMFMLANLAPERYRRPAAREDGDPGVGSGGTSDPDNSSREPIINFNYERLPAPKPKKLEGESDA